MSTMYFPKPKAALETEYRRVCNKNNLKYVWYFSLFACVVFGFHLLHHFRLGVEALSAEMMPYTLLYSFAIIYPGLNMVLLSRLKDVPALSPIASFVELAFPFFMASIAVLLSVLGAQHAQGITPFPILLMIICFLLHGQFKLLLYVIALSWIALSVLLITTIGTGEASPSIAIGFTSGLACIVIAYITERMRVQQFEVITELNISNRQLKLLSSQDHLTGLLNRRSFDRMLEREMARSERFDHPLALLVIDVDNFKEVNDTFGHVHGDDIIKRIAQSIKLHVRDVDFVGRMGGDEFVVLLIETDKNYSLQVADRMRIEVGKLATGEDKTPLTISIGHAQFAGDSLTGFLERADKALYKAKGSGKNKVRSSVMAKV